MSLRRRVGTLAVALTVPIASAAPAEAYVFNTNFQRYRPVPSLVHQRNLETSATATRHHKHASGGSQRQDPSGAGKRDGLPTGNS